MTKMQKVWLWIFIAMFAVPEILFFITPLSISSVINNFSGINIRPPIYLFISKQFLTDNPIYPLFAMVIEWVGILGLLIKSIKFNKKIVAVLLGIILVWLSFIIFVGYVVGVSMSFP
ncbi:MAG: hypothetical protein A3G45_02730 [Candidatus Staskawiczbacteria bacterium RIFCSPLOWO2_12_FULL_37_15]|uniref:Uncharacterized protein n=1 Tax=Candidatus Staskawiczbacteria bacterium RIFCSPLOWO2_12_FULL_37_15 TaxID=1802218 RepID=A0A1G2IKR3_9BACT|nr:MAG: hypothetical protein A3G45_02730 [Candidatus Staskawiczbacteria bacterium RIFCSPLOWO2_12_FULL_37_15]